jgi:hypothetical protein
VVCRAKWFKSFTQNRLRIKTEGRTPDGTAKVVSLFLAECHSVGIGEVEVQDPAKKPDDL